MYFHAAFPDQKRGGSRISNFRISFFRSLSFPDFLRRSFFSLFVPRSLCFLSRERKRGGRRDYNVAHFFSFFPVLFGCAGNYTQFRPFSLFLSLGTLAMAFCPSSFRVCYVWPKYIFEGTKLFMGCDIG